VGQCRDSSPSTTLLSHASLFLSLSLESRSVQLSLEPAAAAAAAATAAAFPFRGFCDCVTVTKALKAWLTIRGHVTASPARATHASADDDDDDDDDTAFSRYLGTKRLFRLTRALSFARLVAPTDWNARPNALRLATLRNESSNLTLKT